MSRIAVVIAYFGKFPDIASYFFESVRHVREIDVLLFTDARLSQPLSDNVKVYPFTLADFSSLASRTLGLEVKVDTAFKLCDFKPALWDDF